MSRSAAEGETEPALGRPVIRAMAPARPGMGLAPDVPLWKRALDVGLAGALLVPGLPLLAVIGVVVWAVDGRPVFYGSPRANAPRNIFTLWKLRTMENDPGGAEVGVSGGDKTHRITRVGRFLRRTRLDELPQLLNVIRGDMSFVGPRPPAPMYADSHNELYRDVLTCRTGITGLATVIFHSHEEMLLRGTTTAEETETVYVRRCIPRKARLDLIYKNNRSLKLDLYLIYLTAGKLLPLPGRRLHRLKDKAKRV